MISKRQKQVLDFIKDYQEKYSYAPSLDEIRKKLKLASVSTAHFHVEKLKDLGFLNKGDNQPRSIDTNLGETLVEIPLVGSIAAGCPIEAIAERESIAVPKSKLPKNGTLFALRVKGESMIDENIHDDDIVVIKSQSTYENGDKVVALVNNTEATLKKIYNEGQHIRLQPANKNFSPLIVDSENLLVQGKLVTVIKTLEKVHNRAVISKPLTEYRNTDQRTSLFDMPPNHKFPSTRFQGSKTKLLEKIWDSIKDIPFDTALDVFGGTGSVGYMLKSKGKQVFYNDYLKSNYIAGLALIENNGIKLDDKDVDYILSIHSNIEYPNFIQKSFKDIYFTEQENQWLDIVSTNIRQIKNEFKQALAYFALFQSCLAKRPYNLFHRKNLYVRLANVERSFGNKATWEKPFEKHFIKFVEEANRAVFNNKKNNKAFNLDVFDVNQKIDLVYIDSPYISGKGMGVDYTDFYHFLEGLCNYQDWHSRIDYSSKHLKFKSQKSIWSNPNEIRGAFDKLFKKFQNSTLVVSYRSDGIPSSEELQQIMSKYKKDVREVFRSDYKYVLSKNKESKEILIIGQ